MNTSTKILGLCLAMTGTASADEPLKLVVPQSMGATGQMVERHVDQATTTIELSAEQRDALKAKFGLDIGEIVLVDAGLRCIVCDNPN